MITDRIKRFRAHDLEGSRVLRTLISFSKLLVSLHQGYGKSYLNKFATVAVAEYDDFITLIASENNKVIDEHEKNCKENGIDYLRLHGRSEGSCSSFKKIQSLTTLKYYKSVKKICQSCVEKCPYFNSKNDLKRRSKTVRVILLTYPYLLHNKWLFTNFKGRHLLQIMDEPAFLRPNYESYTKSVLTKMANRFREVGYPTYAEAIGLIVQGGAVESIPVIPELTEEDEIKLSSLSLVNPESLLNELKGKKFSSDGKLYIRNLIPLAGDFVLIAAPVKPSIIQRLYNLRSIETVYDDKFQLPEDTQVIRVANSSGSFRNIPGNLDRICSLFSVLTVNRIEMNKRVLLIAKRTQIEMFTESMNKKFHELCSPLRVVPYDSELSEFTIPIMNYGVSGFNDFEAYDCVYAMSSFNTKVSIIQDHLNFILDYKNVSEIDTIGEDREVRGIFNSEMRKLANDIVHFHEGNTIMQAIGRVRPFTQHGKEVVVLYKGNLEVGETVVSSLQDLRSALNIADFRLFRMSRQRSVAINMRLQGFSNDQISSELGISVRTLQRLLKEEK